MSEIVQKTAAERQKELETEKNELRAELQKMEEARDAALLARLKELAPGAAPITRMKSENRGLLYLRAHDPRVEARFFVPETDSDLRGRDFTLAVDLDAGTILGSGVGGIYGERREESAEAYAAESEAVARYYQAAGAIIGLAAEGKNLPYMEAYAQFEVNSRGLRERLEAAYAACSEAEKEAKAEAEVLRLARQREVLKVGFAAADSLPLDRSKPGTQYRAIVAEVSRLTEKRAEVVFYEYLVIWQDDGTRRLEKRIEIDRAFRDRSLPLEELFHPRPRIAYRGPVKRMAPVRGTLAEALEAGRIELDEGVFDLFGLPTIRL